MFPEVVCAMAPSDIVIAPVMACTLIVPSTVMRLPCVPCDTPRLAYTAIFPEVVLTAPFTATFCPVPLVVDRRTLPETVSIALPTLSSFTIVKVLAAFNTTEPPAVLTPDRDVERMSTSEFSNNSLIETETVPVATDDVSLTNRLPLVEVRDQVVTVVSSWFASVPTPFCALIAKPLATTFVAIVFVWLSRTWPAELFNATSPDAALMRLKLMLFTASTRTSPPLVKMLEPDAMVTVCSESK